MNPLYEMKKIFLLVLLLLHLVTMNLSLFPMNLMVTMKTKMMVMMEKKKMMMMMIVMMMMMMTIRRRK